MINEYFGVKELLQVTLKAKSPMQFGSRYFEQGEPVLYFNNITMSTLSEKNNPIFARGGWANMPRVIWEDRSEVRFVLSEGILSPISMGILFGSDILTKVGTDALLVPKREGPFQIDTDRRIYLSHWPKVDMQHKTFIFEYSRDSMQKKIYGKGVYGLKDPFDDTKERPCIELYEDKMCTKLADITKEYIVDYYYEYEDEALIYLIKKQRFNGLFTLEGKFYSKDENDGLNYTNLIYMPKVRVVSDINLRLGERADPTMSVFNIIGLPETVSTDKQNLILQVTRLNSDINADI